MAKDIFELPEIPNFSDEEVEKCIKEKDFRYIFFEFYKFIGVLVNLYCSIDFKTSEINNNIDQRTWGTLIGLLSRIQNSILTQICLAQERKHNQTIMMLDRAIDESCLNILWIIKYFSIGSTKFFIANSIRKDLVIEDEIKKNQKERGKILEVEKRLVRQKNIRIKESGLNEEDIRDFAKKYPDIKSLYEEFFNLNGYIFGYIMQSHTVHGDWIGLRYSGCYLEFFDGVYYPRLEDFEFDPVQFYNNIYFILEALKSFSVFTIGKSNDDYFNEIFSEITKFYIKHNEVNEIVIQ